MDNFECIRCGYTTNKKSSIIGHMNRKKICDRLLESLKYSDEEIYNLSLIRKKDRENSENKCKYCNKIYCNKYFLEKHIKDYCTCLLIYLFLEKNFLFAQYFVSYLDYFLRQMQDA